MRQAAQNAVALKKRARKGLGALGRWAAGGAITAKSPDEELEEAKANTIKAHRESIIWYLQRALEECGRFQSSMMEIRLTREVEKSKSVLYKARGTMPTTEDYSGMNGAHNAAPDYRGKTAQMQEADAVAVEQQLDPEQLQLFAQENQDLLKQYEDHLDQVRYAQCSFRGSLRRLTSNSALRKSHCSRFPSCTLHSQPISACNPNTSTSS